MKQNTKQTPSPGDIPERNWLHDDEISRKIQAEVEEAQAFAAENGLYHRGWRFWPPYCCARCGTHISARQFMFSRLCGGCDTSDSRTARLPGMFDNRWFLMGRAELENREDRWFIDVEFIDWTNAEDYPRQRRDRPRHTPPMRLRAKERA